MLSQGVPMILAGDEFGRTQQGNNNAYCQDNEISWLDWSLLKKNSALYNFYSQLISLRKRHPILRRSHFFPPSEVTQGFQEIIWQSLKPGQPDWSPACRALAFLLDGRAAQGQRDNDFFVMLNADLKPKTFTVPAAPEGRRWLTVIDTAAKPPADILPESEGKPLEKPRVIVAAMTAVVLISQAK
jgi:glycogen operon protein